MTISTEIGLITIQGNRATLDGLPINYESALYFVGLATNTVSVEPVSGKCDLSKVRVLVATAVGYA